MPQEFVNFLWIIAGISILLVIILALLGVIHFFTDSKTGNRVLTAIGNKIATNLEERFMTESIRERLESLELKVNSLQEENEFFQQVFDRKSESVPVGAGER